MFLQLDYCNAVLAGLLAIVRAPLQRVLHAAVRLVNDLRSQDHVTQALKRTSLVANSSTDGVQTVPARTKVTDWPHTGLHLDHTSAPLIMASAEFGAVRNILLHYC